MWSVSPSLVSARQIAVEVCVRDCGRGGGIQSGRALKCEVIFGRCWLILFPMCRVGCKSCLVAARQSGSSRTSFQHIDQFQCRLASRFARDLHFSWTCAKRP